MKATLILRSCVALLGVFPGACAPERVTSARTAAPADFEGTWTGEWSWRRGHVCTLVIRAGRATFSDLPVDAHGAGTRAESGTGRADFAKGWAEDAPCVLIATSAVILPVYMTVRRDRLYFAAPDMRESRHIIFRRK